jgi:hypothetical protein
LAVVPPCDGAELIRPAVDAIRLEWYGWHGFWRDIASNLCELGASEEVVQGIFRHAKPHVTKKRYIKAFDPAFLAAMNGLEESMFNKCSAGELSSCGKLLKVNAGEVAERLKAAVC